ncbi:MAG: YegS/Rv2252/BmrU family lipid kinase [Clostridia bacterium]|nr:YegS/Rv2252/BmrU family lipid kinase [Clostridia bacterium]
MEYIFIVNNYAGDKKVLEKLEKELNSYKLEFPYKIYSTTSQKDATIYVSNYCVNNPQKEVCFVSCGGDGTINEVATGIVNFENKYLAVLAYGSGNDFIKYYSDRDFTSIEKLVHGESEKIDVLQINEFNYSINMCNIGFEAMVGSVANKVKQKGGKHSYTKGIISAIFKGRKNDIEIYADGEKITNGKMLLCSVANCKFAGGKYMCSPNASNKDGLIDVCLFHSMSLFRFLSCINLYKKGKHLESKKIEKKRVYKQCTNVKIVAPELIEIVADGEVIRGKEFNINIVPKGINFIVPKL